MPINRLPQTRQKNVLDVCELKEFTRQKAQLEDAKRQFEDKLQAANALYNEVEDMRASLKEHLANEMGMHAEQRRDFDDVPS